MTFELKPDGFGVFHCDTCPEHIESDHVHFSAGLEEIKAKGWRVYRGPDNEWAHGCPACVEDFAQSQPQGRG
jgi:hypothetical protein